LARTRRPRLPYQNLRRLFERRSKVEKFRLYDLRHTFATRFVEAGGDLVTLQALLGHSNIQMVTRYAHPTEKHQFEAIKRMETQINSENTFASSQRQAG